MSSNDFFLLIATVALIFISSFLCAALYWLCRVLRIWHRLSSELERNIDGCVQRFHDAIHALSSLRTVLDIGMQTLQAATAVYHKRQTSRRRKGKQEKEES